MIVVLKELEVFLRISQKLKLGTIQRKQLNYTTKIHVQNQVLELKCKN